MNKLSYKVIGEKEKVGQNYPDLRIVLDGKETTYFFSVEELERSSKEPGTYAIVVCSCGEEGCSGAEVEVLHQGNEIIWNRMWHTDWDGKTPEDEQGEFIFEENKVGAPSLEARPPFRFDKKEYQALAAELSGKRDKQEA